MNLCQEMAELSSGNSLIACFRMLAQVASLCSSFCSLSFFIFFGSLICCLCQLCWSKLN